MNTPSTIQHSFNHNLPPAHLKVFTSALATTSGIFLLIAIMIHTEPISIPSIPNEPPYSAFIKIPTLPEPVAPSKIPSTTSITVPPAAPPITPPPIKPINIDIQSAQLSNVSWTSPSLGYLLPGQNAQEIIDTSMLDSIPRIIIQIAPRIPKSISAGKSITVQFQVDTSGNVTALKIISSDDTNLNALTKRALLRWKFEPGMHHGKPVSFRLIQTISFQ